jgi:hypothetical protein
MFPHERSLVKKLEGKPFALIGVNSDKDRDEAKKLNEERQVSWRSFWDGPTTAGPIASTWNVYSWPTIYVLDARGVIRGKNLRDAPLEKLVEELLKEMDRKKD